jgi:hypothetical protein
MLSATGHEVDPLQSSLPRKHLGDPCIELFTISKTYELAGGKVPALRDVSLHAGSDFAPIRHGEFVIIRGTVRRHLCDLHLSTDAEISLYVLFNSVRLPQPSRLTSQVLLEEERPHC